MITECKEVQVRFCDIDGNERCVLIQVAAIYSVDRNYGADIDGNNGSMEFFIDDYNVDIPEHCNEGIRLNNDDLKILDRKMWKEIESVIFDCDFNTMGA